MTTTIAKVNIRDFNASLKERQSEVVEDAGNLFGYRADRRGELIRVLKKLDITPLNAVSVTKYKKNKEQKSTWDNGSQEYTTTRRWTIVSLGNYDGVIPEAILAKAVQIKKALPAVGFEVHVLTERKQRRRIHLPDPFLVAVMPGPKPERIVIDVWDEPEFEKNLYA